MNARFPPIIFNLFLRGKNADTPDIGRVTFAAHCDHTLKPNICATSINAAFLGILVISTSAAALLPKRVPRNPISWITLNDYPAEALDKGMQGKVEVVLSVTPEGSVSKCVVISNSPSPILNKTTCDLLLERAKFFPVKAGDNVDNEYARSFVWKLPAYLPYSAEDCIEHKYQHGLAAHEILVHNNCKVTKLVNVCTSTEGVIGNIQQGEQLIAGQIFKFSYFNASDKIFAYNINSCSPSKLTTRKDLCLPQCPAPIRECKSPILPDVTVNRSEQREYYINRMKPVLLRYQWDLQLYKQCRLEQASIVYPLKSVDFMHVVQNMDQFSDVELRKVIQLMGQTKFDEPPTREARREIPIESDIDSGDDDIRAAQPSENSTMRQMNEAYQRNVIDLLNKKAAAARSSNVGSSAKPSSSYPKGPATRDDTACSANSSTCPRP